jgi:hypothetical protein
MLRNGSSTSRILNSKLKTQNLKLSSVWWIVVGAGVALLLVRFGMRAVGVRDELGVPGGVYALTGPLVQPFYRFFPVGDARFDYHVAEVASIAAAGAVVALGLAVYAVGLVVFNRALNARG